MMNLNGISFLIKEARVEEDSLRNFIYPAKGERVKPILKILLTNRCQGECSYCANNRDTTCLRFSISPKDLSRYFMNLCKKKLVEGLFISNALYKNANFSQEQILETLIILRKKMGYKGYLHAKILPGSDFALIRELFKYADRLSINLEFPTQKDLSLVSRKELYYDLMRRLKYISRINENERLKSGITTQFVVGATSANDREYLTMSSYLYRNLKLRRVYYSGFVPIRGTPLEGLAPVNPLRIKRLYQADFLIREYGILPSQLAYDRKENLLLDKDVKEAFALKNRDFYPVNVNKASWQELIKVPGIGKNKASQILKLRKEERITSFDKLRKLKVPMRAKIWICY